MARGLDREIVRDRRPVEIGGQEEGGGDKLAVVFAEPWEVLEGERLVEDWPLDRVVKGDGITEFVADHRRWRWQDTPAGEPVAYRQHVQLRPGCL